MVTWVTASAKTRNKHLGYTRQVFSLAVDYGYRTTNPVVGIKKFRERSTEENGEISILSAEDTEKLFRAADPEVIPFLVLNFFCGVRRSTIERLDWSELSIAKKRVIVPRHKGKNRQRYAVTLSDNAIEWLKPKAQTEGSFLALSRAFQSGGKPCKRRTRELIIEAAEKAEIELPDNAGRQGWQDLSPRGAFSADIMLKRRGPIRGG
jgi:integrase